LALASGLIQYLLLNIRCRHFAGKSARAPQAKPPGCARRTAEAAVPTLILAILERHNQSPITA